MAKKSSKAQKGALTSLDLRFGGGLNLSDAPGNIADNELTRAFNYIYDPATGVPMVRPGTTCQTALVCDSVHPIVKVYHYEKSPTESWTVAVCNGNLYYLSGVDLNGWTLIGALNDAVTVPSMITFHATLIIADGGTNMKTWDGSSYSSLSDGLGATALAVIKGRIAANCTTRGGNDLVTLCGEYDETKWNTVSEGAVGARAGYGDNMSVNAFAVFGTNLIISKKGDADKKLYRLDVSDPDPTNWAIPPQLTANNCSMSAHTMVGCFNNVFFADTNGFKSLKGVTEYGDIQVDLVGAKVNTVFSANQTCDEMTYLPYFTAIWFILGEQIYAYHQVADASGNITNAFTSLQFNQGRIHSVCQAGSDTIYMAGHSGYLYKLDLTKRISVDYSTPITYSDYESSLETKRFPFFGGGILKRAELYLKPINAGSSMFSVATPQTENITIKVIQLRDEGMYLSNATGYLDDATVLLYDMGKTAWYESTRNQVRGSSLQFRLQTTSGRVGVEGLRAEIALVEGE